MKDENSVTALSVPKPNGRVQLCLDPVGLNIVLIRLVHRGPALNNILPRLAGIKYLTLSDAGLCYHSLNLFLVCLADTATYNCHLVWCLLVIYSRER